MFETHYKDVRKGQYMNTSLSVMKRAWKSDTAIGVRRRFRDTNSFGSMSDHSSRFSLQLYKGTGFQFIPRQFQSLSQYEPFSRLFSSGRI